MCPSPAPPPCIPTLGTTQLSQNTSCPGNGSCGTGCCVSGARAKGDRGDEGMAPKGSSGLIPKAARAREVLLGYCCCVRGHQAGPARGQWLQHSGDGAVGEHRAGQWPWGRVLLWERGHRAPCSPGTRDFFQSHPECSWRGWLRLCVGLGQPQSPEPLAPSVTPK